MSFLETEEFKRLLKTHEECAKLEVYSKAFKALAEGQYVRQCLEILVRDFNAEFPAKAMEVK